MSIAINQLGDRTRAEYRDWKLWAIFLLYGVVLSLTLVNHELWGDELHSWNIAKGSGSYLSLLSNTRYEGHPPVWYTILWLIGKCTHNPVAMQVAQGILSLGVVFLLVFFSPFPFFAKALIPFGYFFLFEYGVLSRNYAVGLLLAFCLCRILFKEFPNKPVQKFPNTPLLYYILLFLLSNTHLLALLLACSFHAYFLLTYGEQQKKRNGLLLHILLGALLFLPALYFIAPPSDSQIAPHFWIDIWNAKEQLAVITRAPVRAFVPIPAWWNEHFWNTQFLLEWQKKAQWMAPVISLVSLTIVSLVIFVLARSRKACLFFVTNLLLTIVMASIFPLNDARYTGFLYIGFVVACWLSLMEIPNSGDKTLREVRNTSFTGKRKTIVIILFLLQLAGGLFVCVKDITLPFSQIFRVKELLQKIPAWEIKESGAAGITGSAGVTGATVVSDHTSVDDLAAYTDSAWYCLDLQGRKSYILWDREFDTRTNAPHPFSDGVKLLFSNTGISRVYLVSAWAPERIIEADSLLPTKYRFDLLDKITGAIEKSSNLYLYRIDEIQEKLLP